MRSETETQFRMGACHGAQWLCDVAKNMAGKGASSAEVFNHLSDLNEVLEDWRESMVEMPTGNPWDWPHDQLASFIERRRKDW